MSVIFTRIANPVPGRLGDTANFLRERADVGIIMVTASGETVDRIVGLEMGADDYLPKPCNPRELVARLRAILRRAGAPDREPVGAPGPLRLGDVTLDSGRRSVQCAGREIQLTGAEFSILNALMRNPGEIVSKDDLSRSALDRAPSAYDRSIDVHVSRIRKKLGDHPDGATRIRSVRGAGYLYALPSEAELDG